MGFSGFRNASVMMADSGDDTNPFSFKTFVSRKGQPTKDTNDDDSIFDLTTDASQHKKEKIKKQILVVEDEEITKSKKKGKLDNPFSFKKFLATGGEKSDGTRNKSGGRNTQMTKTSKQDKSGVLPSDLPDFIQDHFCDSVSDSHHTHEQSDEDFQIADSPPVDLPDFTAHSTSNRTVKSDVQINVTENFSKLLDSTDDKSVDNNSDIDELFELSDEENSTGQLDNLPDFLSENVAVIRDKTIGSHSVNESSSHTNELETLKAENVSLKEHVQKLKARRKENEARILELQRMLKEQKKKELEETAAMEQAMGQVEENLVKTMQRAVQAEGNVSKLKEEIKLLQAELHSVRGEKETGIHPGFNDLKERTSYVADQLNTATKTAENSLKQLLTGVDQLKLLSQVLSSIDKISETNETRSNT